MSTILDGSTTYWKNEAFKIDDGQTGTASVWFKLDALSVTQGAALLVASPLAADVARFAINITATGEVQVVGSNSGGTLILRLLSSGLGIAVDTWYNLLASWDLANAAGSLLVNGTDVLATSTLTNDTLDYTTDEWMAGAWELTAGALFGPVDGIIDEIYFSTQYIDLSDSANERLFYGREGTHIGLGHKARVPTGSQPELFLTHGPGNFGRNDGTGGNFDAFGTATFDKGRPAPVETLARGFKGERWRESERSGIPFNASRLVSEPASGLEVARREYSTDRDEINRNRRFRSRVFEV